MFPILLNDAVKLYVDHVYERCTQIYTDIITNVIIDYLY